MQKIWEHEQALGQYLYNSLIAADIPGLKVYGSQNLSKRTGIVSFNIDGLHGMDVSLLLDQYGVCIRNGHHCAQPLHDTLGVSSSMRASVYFYNGQEDVDYFVAKLKEVVNVLKNYIR
jgi:cysteine desulfurase/selenocysteine lyase